VKRIMQKSALAVSALALATATTFGVLSAVPAGAQSSDSGQVTVGDNYFKPGQISVTAGTKVTWTNKGKIIHSVTPNKGKAFGTKSLARGKKYSFTFKKPGTYAYYCTFHGSPGSGQHGTIVVTAAPTTTTTGLLDQKSG
jgi:plastocyanin